MRTSRVLFVPIIFMFAAVSNAAPAHVHWTRGNDIDPRCIGLYHIESASPQAAGALAAAAGLPADRDLLIQAPAGGFMQASSDTPEPFLDPYSLRTQSGQIAQSTAVIDRLDGDLSIEFWFKWEPSLTYQHIRVGLASGANLVIARNVVEPASDLFGIRFTHGDYASAPGFTNWQDVGIEEASLDEWRHMGLTIYSTGMHFDSGSGHDVYNAGSVARIYLNGHAVGSFPHTIDIADMRAHEDSAIRIENVAGVILLDEITLWSYDWSENGAVANPFSNGRGAGFFAQSAIRGWRLLK